jgi:hypothetical protein
VSNVCYLINKSLRAALDGKVMEEVWIGNEVDYSLLKVFGCPPMCTYLVKNYQNLIRSLDKVVISSNVVFDENSMLRST